MFRVLTAADADAAERLLKLYTHTHTRAHTMVHISSLQHHSLIRLPFLHIKRFERAHLCPSFNECFAIENDVYYGHK